MIAFDSIIGFKLLALIALYLFLPLTALTFFLFRRQRRILEIERIISILNINPNYRTAYEDANSSRYYFWALAYTSIVSWAGLVLLLFAVEINMNEFPSVQVGNVDFPQAGSRLVFAMAFLGAYLWGLQYLLYRYSMNDLAPGVYYGLCIRMMLATVIALVLYNAYEAMVGSDDSGSSVTSTVWPAMALLIGMFPQSGLRWLQDRIPLLSPQPDSSVRSAPLEMVEGISLNDRMRLEELGIDSCYDLAATDFVPLILKTPYGARQLVDWILQAKLCVYFGEAVQDLRQHSIRTILDIETLQPAEIEDLSTETRLTKSALERAQASIANDAEIERLRAAAQALGRFWQDQ